jgi:predicted dehydrogenase
MAGISADLTRLVKRARDAARERSLEQGESGWGSPVMPPPVVTRPSGGAFRVVVVGAGVQGGVLARGAHTLQGAELVAVVDLDQERSSQVLDRLSGTSARAMSDAASAFAETSPDLVVVATTAPSHVALGDLALDASVPRIMLEKPIGTNYAESAALVERARGAGAALSVNYVRRYLTDHRAVLAAVQAGQIGQLRLMTAQVGAGELAMQGSHFVDLFRMFSGAEVTEVCARLRPTASPNARGADFEDPTGVLELRASTGARAYIDFEPDLPARDIVVTLRGDDGLIVLEEHQRVWTLRSRSGRTWTFPFAEPFAPTTFATRSLQGALTEERPSCSGADGLAALEVILAAHHSSRRGGMPVALPLSSDDRDLEVRFP